MYFKDIEKLHQHPNSGSFNLTPVIDIVFLLILFFLVVCQFIEAENFPVNVPEKNEQLLYRLQEKINSRIRDITKVKAQGLKDSSVILCSYGSITRSCDQAVQEAAKQGVKLGAISLKTIWPFPDFVFG